MIQLSFALLLAGTVELALVGSLFFENDLLTGLGIGMALMSLGGLLLAIVDWEDIQDRRKVI